MKILCLILILLSACITPIMKIRFFMYVATWVVFYTLRHTFVSWLVEDGTDLYTVQMLMGHSSLEMTGRYAHFSENTLQNAVRNLEMKIKESKKNSVVDISEEA